MKKILIILALLTSTVYAQTDSDIKLFNDLNTYRVSNGVKSLKFDTLLYKNGSVKQLNNMVDADSIYHSDVSEETVMSSTSLPKVSAKEVSEFDAFLKKYYNMSYDFNPTSEDNKRDELMNYVTKYIIFIFHKSAPHKASMLSDYNYFGGAALSIKDIKFNSGVSVPSFLNKTKDSGKVKANYKFELFSCMNFNTKELK